jgi:hypothetical protein
MLTRKGSAGFARLARRQHQALFLVRKRCQKELGDKINSESMWKMENVHLAVGDLHGEFCAVSFFAFESLSPPIAFASRLLAAEPKP